MAGIDTAVETARRYIIKRPRLTRLLDKANARVLTLIAPAGFGKTTLAREWVAERPHVWYRGTTATADVAALAASLAEAALALLDDEAARVAMTGRASSVIAAMSGALPRTLAELERFLPPRTTLQHAS